MWDQKTEEEKGGIAEAKSGEKRRWLGVMGSCQLRVSKNLERDMAGCDQQTNPMTLTRVGSLGG